MRIVIHCGLNKTGTSALQHFLANNEQPLRNHGILYPSNGVEAEAHHPWALANIYFDFDTFNGLCDAMFAQITTEHTIVLSSEAFQDAGRIDKICEAFRGHSVSAVFYLRNYVDYFASWWGEDVQTGTICAHMRTYAIMKQRYLFPILQRWAQTLGRENVKVLHYDKDALIGGDIRCDFMKRSLDIDINHDPAWSLSDEHKNPSIAGNLLFLKRMINLAVDHADLPALRTEFELLSQISETFAGRFFVEPADVNDIRALYADDRNTIANEFGLTVPIEAPKQLAQRSPNMATMAEDMALIESFAREHDFVLCGYLDRFARMFAHQM